MAQPTRLLGPPRLLGTLKYPNNPTYPEIYQNMVNPKYVLYDKKYNIYFE